MQKTEIESAVEALLFYSGDSISCNRLCELCDVEAITIHMAVHKLNAFYNETYSGIEIIEVEDGYQMCTAPRHMALIQRFKQKPVKNLLTQALIETLAIVAYSQPITRTQIEDVRGVRCEHTISKLMEYGLIEEVGRLNVIGRPILFGTTTEFLRHFGFKNLEELPQIKEELLEKFKEEVQLEMNYYEDHIKEEGPTSF
ncbi:SMC-Scp complex subunit ScpB [Sporanaerobium hydrogeniformans]|uniref:SMC-Scp complex subunit ScpB n=1 Tax=Sporanaerobium hydrogeniformans TaxID=3072179 RepID=A0AC61DE70_9FIRM|nr:SMC-Scp complex subunit ScpB [Sporanaerobium hydrogeniformans]PHV71155.1 SMC-Scp complex subunit ScpB [Sporanaerobium hydrogeniformans]